MAHRAHQHEEMKHKLRTLHMLNMLESFSIYELMKPVREKELSGVSKFAVAVFALVFIASNATCLVACACRLRSTIYCELLFAISVLLMLCES